MIYQRGFCARCGQPLNVTEKLKNLTTHAVCPADRPSAEVTSGLSGASETVSPPVAGAHDVGHEEARWQRASNTNAADVPSAGWPASPAGSAPALVTPVANQPRYHGATLVSLFFWWSAWIVAVLGTLGAIAAASADYCSRSLFSSQDCSGQSGTRVVMFFAVLLGSWFYACLLFWLAYMLRLQSDMEIEVRRAK